MTAAGLLQDLHVQDIRLEVHGLDLIVDAPEGKLTKGLVQAISSLKPDLLSLLRHDAGESVSEEPVQNNGSHSVDAASITNTTAEQGDPLSAVSHACFVCRSEVFWRRDDFDHWVCPLCHPPASDTVVYGCRIQIQLRPPK